MEILFPMTALVGWTFAVLLLIPVARFRASLRGQVTVADFRYGESDRVPANASLPNRNLMNLLELPLLYYVACLTFYVTKSADTAAVYLAWSYVALRVAHSLVHVTYNNVLHRLSVFAASNVVLMILWIRLVIALTRA